jgi:hypothetical protein
MSLNLDAARNFSQTILQHYDQKFTTPPLEEQELEQDEESNVDPLAEKTQEYNRVGNMTDWYQTAHVFEPITNNDISTPEELKQRVLEASGLQFSALDRLTAIKDNSWDRNEEDPYMLTELVRNPAFLQFSSFLPLPVLSFSSPKSELDSLIFEKAYCALPDRERAQVVQSMEQACQNLDPHFFNSQHRIYRIQGIATSVFRNSLFKGLVCTGLIAGSIILILFVVTPKLQAVFTKALADQWEVIVAQKPNKLVIWLNNVYHQAQAFNEFTTKPAWRAHATSYVAPRIIPLTKRISSYAPPALTIAYYSVYPKTFFNMCANLFISYFLLKPSLVAFKILNGTEYKTVQALKEKFKKDPLACANALKAHALWMHLQKRGTPEATLGLLGYFSTPAA